MHLKIKLPLVLRKLQWKMIAAYLFVICKRNNNLEQTGTSQNNPERNGTSKNNLEQSRTILNKRN